MRLQGENDRLKTKLVLALEQLRILKARFSRLQRQRLPYTGRGYCNEEIVKSEIRKQVKEEGLEDGQQQ